MKRRFWIEFSLLFPLFLLLANSFLFLSSAPALLWLWVPLFLLLNILPGIFSLTTQYKRLKVCYHGAMLLSMFAVSLFLTVVLHLVLGTFLLPGKGLLWLWSALLAVGVHFVLFWNGMLSVYLTSLQLGIKQRVIGALCGLIPIVNLVILNRIIRICLKEVSFETQKEQQNRTRSSQRICATRYPILMVHGVFFRDSLRFNYWGRIPGELERNGAQVYYGNHQSAASVADSAAELTARIQEILEETGAEKVNIIAHSKGGLDCRYAMAKLGMSPYVASLTTVNTPHIGCIFADYLLFIIPEKVKNKVAATYNKTLRKLGDHDPDFLAAVQDLTASGCAALNREMPMPEGVFCQSIGSVLTKATSGKFPMNLAFALVKHFDGENDGLVAERAFAWGEKYTLLRPTGKRGISHGDMIDMNRENIPDFDVREFYVSLVAELKDKGL